jgi:hypothetical protein
MTTNATLTPDAFAALLGIKQGHTKTEQWVQVRLAALGMKKACTRCGGSGHYSYCQMHGTTCFKCGGSGAQTQPLTPELFAKAKAKVEDGSNAAHVARLREDAALKKVRKSVMDAWSAASKVNVRDWRGWREPLHGKASEFNERMCRAYEAVQKAEEALGSATFTATRKPTTLEKREAAEVSLPALKQALRETADRALETIATTLAEIRAWHATLTPEQMAELRDRNTEGK